MGIYTKTCFHKLESQIFLLILTIYLIHLATGEVIDPYKILGITRSASATEVKKVWKALAKEWHPDKNKDPKAEDRFVEINRAYELLSDPERRRLYDQRGIYEESPSLRQKPDYSAFNRFDPIEEILTFTTGGAFHFPFADGIAFLHKQSISSRTFDQTTLPKSNYIPQLLLFYGDYCNGCARAAPSWRSISEELQGIGMDVGSVHAERERTIARRMGISAVPAVVLLIESHPHHYRESVISAAKVIAFVRSKLPHNLMTSLDEHNVDRFLNSWQDNRIRVVIFGTLPIIRLRYLLLAFQYRDRAAFGFVRNQDPDTDILRLRFGISKALDSILVFKELPKPIASLAMSDIPPKLMKDLVENNKFLFLPRLSSQTIMDTICPTESSTYRRRLCAILITTELMDDMMNQETFRKFVISKPEYIPTRIRFAYIYEETQHDFINSLLTGGLPMRTSTNPAQNMVVIWRQDEKKIAYEWLEGGWDANHANSSGRKLEGTIQKLLTEKTALTHHVEIKELTDEHATGLTTKIFKKISIVLELMRGHLTRDVIIQATSLVATVLFIIAGGYLMNYLVRLEEESILAKARANAASTGGNIGVNNSSSISNRSTAQGSSSPNYTTSPELRVHEMRGETYNGLVRLIKPGCRTVVLLLDTDTKSSLLPKFQRCVWPYRKNKSLQFAFMHVDRGGGLSWYKQLLLLSLSEQRNLTINPRNCVGTVLSLNGHRKYFCVFHATLPGIGNTRRSRGGYRNGGFLGFDSDNSSDDHSDVERGRHLSIERSSEGPGGGVLFTNHLLDNLSNWLDRLFEGSTHRYHINYWPDFPVK